MIKLNRLRQLRLEKGLLQSDIAKIISKSERTVGFYETGERDMGTETLAILSDFFNVFFILPSLQKNGIIFLFQAPWNVALRCLKFIPMLFHRWLCQNIFYMIDFFTCCLRGRNIITLFTRHLI